METWWHGMKPWHEALPQLRQIIQERFPQVTADDVLHWADKIFDGSQAAASLQWLERSDTRPADDIERLKKASSRLRSAANEVEGLGWHGAKAVQGFTGELHKMKLGLPGTPVLSAQVSAEVLAGFLRDLADRINSSAKNIDANAPTVMSAFGEDAEPGRPKNAPTKTQSYFTVAEAANAFKALSGSEPSREISRLNGKPLGDFHEFVKAIFEALEVNASPDSAIKKYLGKKSGKK